MKYERDRAFALEKGYLFKVMTKEAQGKKWNTVRDKVSDLREAMLLAKSLDSFEVSIFTRNGFKYWSSLHPDLLNSTVLTMEITNKHKS